eukprot:Gb_15836 [translate_table: standard]
MNLFSQKSQSHLWDSSTGGYEFGWGATPGADMKEPSRHNGTMINPALIAIVAVLGSAALIVSYYKIFFKYCKPCRWSSLSRRRRGFDPEELDDSQGAGLQDPEGWQIFTHSYGLEEAVIKSIPLCIFRRSDKFIDSTECAVCLVEFEENEPLRLLPKCSHAFHVNCIDVWLRSHANCPLCRANVVSGTPFVPAMASRIRPSLEHGMAGVVHDSFRSGDSPDGINNARNPAHAEFIILDSRIQSRSIDLETEMPSVFDGPNTQNTCVEEGSERKGMETGPRLLTRSYSFGCSGNEHHNLTSEMTRDIRINVESSLDSLLVTDTASPWRYRRTFRWSKRFNSPFNSRGLFTFSSRGLRSPFFRKGSSSSAVNSSSVFTLSPARDHNRRSMTDSRHITGVTRIRGGSSSPPFFRVGRSDSVTSVQSMTSPLFIKRSFSVFTSSRLRTGDPEALLSPHRFNPHE